MRLTLQLLGREGCHLCDALADELATHPASARITLRHVDVDSDPALRARYGNDVPVLLDDRGQELCRHFFDPAALDAYLGEIR